MELRSAARDGLSGQLYLAFVFAARECVRQALVEIGATTASTPVFASASGDFERVLLAQRACRHSDGHRRVSSPAPSRSTCRSRRLKCPLVDGRLGSLSAQASFSIRRGFEDAPENIEQLI